MPPPAEPQQATEDQQPWLAVGATSGAVAAAIALITAAVYSRRRKKAKGGGWNTSAVPHCNTDVELADSEDFSDSADSEKTSIEIGHSEDGPHTEMVGSIPQSFRSSSSFQSTSKAYSHPSHAKESSSGVSVGSSFSLSKVLQSHAVEILQQSPDALGLVKLLSYIGSGVSSRVRNSCALPGAPVLLLGTA